MDTKLLNLIDSKLKKHEKYIENPDINFEMDEYEENKIELLELLIKYYKFNEEIE